MPANEQTWRNTKLLHVIFAVSSVAMLLTTLWMTADDNNRPWKDYQRKFIELDARSSAFRASEQESADFEKKQDDLQKALDESKGIFTPADEKNVEEFVRRDEEFAKQFAKLVEQNNVDFKVADDRSDREDIQSRAAEVLKLAEAAKQSKSEDSADVRKARAKLLEKMNDLIGHYYKFREDHFTIDTKNAKAYLSAAQSQFDQAVEHGASPGELKQRQKAVDQANDKVTVVTALMQAAVEQRKGMENALAAVTEKEDVAKKALDDHRQALQQLQTAEKERSLSTWKQIVTVPILDAFNGPLRPANRWLPQLPWNNNFRQVARFDRCETCHQGMDRSLPGQPTQPAFPPFHIVTPPIELPTPDKAPHAATAATKDAPAEVPTVQSVYGFRLADSGIFSPNDVTVKSVYPNTSASKAGLMAGDVIEAVGDAHLQRPAQADEYLLQNVEWGKPLKLTVRRGVPEPYTSHPRLDLFVGSTSPHPVDSFGCTICHQGQGSETAFKWATHTPDNLLDANRWTRDYEWFNNENWTYPMYSKRFVESGCLKCHHEVVDLEASRKFPDPPAPKLVEGYEVIRRYGCFGCHEINGFNGPANRVGPDMRTEPNYFAAAAQLKTDPGLAKLGKQAVGWADTVAKHPENDNARRMLYELVAAEGAKSKSGKPTVLDNSSLRMEAVLKDVDAPGTIRKVGPSLRHVGSKVGYDFITSWIANPTDFRPDTRMPRFFGLWDHLRDASRGLKESQRLEPIEIRALAEYLLGASQPFEYAQMPSEPQAGAERDQAIARGRKVFEVRGCLACHQHADFPKGVAVQGPNLSRIGAKLATNPDGAKWLYSWLRDPSRYHSRTLMPNLFLDPITDAKGTSTDPAADVTEFLMASRQDWKPAGKYPRELTSHDDSALMELALSYLQDKFPAQRAKGYLYNGIPPAIAGDLVGDEAVLINPDLKKRGQSAPPNSAESGDETGDGAFAYDVLREDRNEVVPADEEPGNAGAAAGVGKQGAPHSKMPPESAEHKQQRRARAMAYVGRRTIGKLGCYACHDIPGYEDARPIGTALADWGRKDPSRLAFEQIAEYVNPEKKSVEEMQLSPDKAFFTDHLLEEDRIGFLWQKLHSPRSYDYKKTDERPYNARLRMPQFTFAVAPEKNDQRIESVMTFVLGLVAEPPPAAYVARPGLPESAIVQGRKVLEQFNCMGCHVLEMDRWVIEYQAGDFGKPPKTVDYPFLSPHFTTEEIEKSQVADRRGRLRATLVGMPLISDRDGSPVRVDEDGAPIKPGDTTSQAFQPFMLFDNMLLDGSVRLVGMPISRKDERGSVPGAPTLPVEERQIVHQYPPLGGDLARLLFPVVVADEAKVNPAVRAKANESWGWLPPPLVGEGRKVQTDWVHDFLLDPFRIRPAAVLRMPKFNMSSAEASTLAHYFAAHDGGEYPYEFNERRDDDYVQQMEKSHPQYMEQALAVVTDNNYCIKCHLLGDFSPAGSPVGLAPRLERVGNRLRPEYVLRWLANPARTLPYTGMPVNIPYVKTPDKPLDKIFAGTSEQQLNGVVDLLMNFDRFARSQISYKSRIKSPPPGAAPPAAAKPAAIRPAVIPPFRAAAQ